MNGKNLCNAFALVFLTVGKKFNGQFPFSNVSLISSFCKTVLNFFEIADFLSFSLIYSMCAHFLMFQLDEFEQFLGQAYRFLTYQQRNHQILLIFQFYPTWSSLELTGLKRPQHKILSNYDLKSWEPITGLCYILISFGSSHHCRRSWFTLRV